MKKQIVLATFFLLSSLINQILADTRKDPDWQKMIDSSDAIALVEYISDGWNEACTKVLKIYKGNIISKEIWITGFDNSLSQDGKIYKGRKYIVFLKHYIPNEKSQDYWKKQIEEKPYLTDYFDVTKKGNVYSLWTPASGHLRICKNKVQFDLLQTTFYRRTAFHPIKEFENFIKNTSKTDNKNFHKKIIKKILNNPDKENTAKYLMMLKLTSYNTYIDIFQDIADNEGDKPHQALAQVLGQINNQQSLKLLIQLLDSKNSIVQGEVVRQLSIQPADFICPILMSHLKTPGEEDLNPSNIIDSANNNINTGKIEIIKTFGKLKYKPAAKELLPLLETNNEYLFGLVVQVLLELENKEYVSYINKHLKKRTKSLIPLLCDLITKNNLQECKPSLMEFISNHNRNYLPGYEYSISKQKGLAYFNDQETIDFLLNDFENFLTNSDSIRSGVKIWWIIHYIEVFTELKVSKAKELIYKSLDYCYGFNRDFAENTELFSIKATIEDSISQKILRLLSDYPVQEVKTLVNITNSNETKKGRKVKYEFIVMLINEEIETQIYKKIEEFLSLPQIVSDSLNIPLSWINTSYYNQEMRMDMLISPLSYFFDYIKELPDKKDLIFLKALESSGILDNDRVKEELKKTIITIEEKLE